MLYSIRFVLFIYRFEFNNPWEKTQLSKATASTLTSKYIKVKQNTKHVLHSCFVCMVSYVTHACSLYLYLCIKKKKMNEISRQ